MKSRAEILPALLDVVAQHNTGSLVIIETGTIRSTLPIARESDGYSTLHISRWVAANPRAMFFSIDRDADACALSASIIEEEIGNDVNGSISIINADSVRTIAELSCAFEPFDFLYLDSDNDASLILSEYNEAYTFLSQNAIVVIDDTFNEEGVKGKDVLLAAKKDATCDVYRYGPMLVIAFGASRDSLRLASFGLRSVEETV